MADYTLAQLEAFLAICRDGTFTAAADRLGITQPTVSLRIRELERALGVTLFARRGTDIRLTRHGALVRRYAERGLSALNEMGTELREIDPLRGYIRIGAAGTFAMTCLPGLMRTVEERHPDLLVELTISNSRELAAKLENGLLDLAFIIGPQVSASISVRDIAMIDHAWLGGTDNPIPKPFITPDDLAGRRIVTNPAPSPLNTLMTQWFRQADREPVKPDTCNSLPATLELVRNGVAMALLPLWIARDLIAAERVIQYQASPEVGRLRMCACYHRRAPEQAVAALIDIARSTVAEFECEQPVPLSWQR
jgi:DNA-binding transcriptional LysR family regulator